MKLRFYMHIPFFLSVSLLLHSHSSSLFWPVHTLSSFLLFMPLMISAFSLFALLLHSGSIIILPHTCCSGDCILRLCSSKHTSSVTLSLEHTLASFCLPFLLPVLCQYCLRDLWASFFMFGSRYSYSCCIMHCDELWRVPCEKTGKHPLKKREKRKNE